MKIKFFTLISCFFIFSSCYEGWEYEQDNGAKKPNPGPSEKPINYILLSTFQPDSSAYDNPVCGLDANFQEYRTNEWDARISSLVEAFKSVSDTVVHVRTYISGTECNSMQSINTYSLNQTPWEPGVEPSPSQQGKKTYQVRASFWDGDVGSASQVNFPGPWSAWNQLKAAGNVVESISYFIISNRVNLGFFDDWYSRSIYEVTDHRTVSGQNIDSPDPTPNGINTRKQIITEDTQELVDFLVQ